MGTDRNTLISHPGFPWAVIGMIAMLLGRIQTLVKMSFRHPERRAMIEQGIHPGQIGFDLCPEANN